MTNILSKHPFAEGIHRILKQHFDDKIVDRFMVILEKDIYDKWVESIWKQNKDDKFVAEVRYITGNDESEYICDVYSWESKNRTEAHLLKYITDKFKDGKIGKDWVFSKNANNIIKLGKYETQLDYEIQSSTQNT